MKDQGDYHILSAMTKYRSGCIVVLVLWWLEVKVVVKIVKLTVTESKWDWRIMLLREKTECTSQDLKEFKKKIGLFGNSLELER